MPLYLSNRDQEEAITAKEAIEALEEGLRQFAKGDAIRRPRIDNFIPTRRTDQFFAFNSWKEASGNPAIMHCASSLLRKKANAWQT